MSKTRIELERPYSVDWKYGYLVTNPQNRKTVILYNNHKDRSSTQYARYLMAVKLGRYLAKNETVDHIDEDKTNDSLTNLQILSMRDNLVKANKKPNFQLVCPICKKSFEKTHTQMRGKKDRAANNMIACSRKCGGKLSHITSKSSLS